MLFQEFMQADSARATQSQGTGLGLAISRRLSRMMCGDIQAESELGQGSTFVFCLPVVKEWAPGTRAAVAEPEDEAPVSDHSAGERAKVRARLLIVGCAESLCGLHGALAAEEIDVAFAENGADGVKIAGELRPNLILLDARLSNPTAWDVVMALKGLDTTFDVPILLCLPYEGPLSNGASQERYYCLHGVHDIIPKPLNREHLWQILRRSFPVQSGGQVLVVEDDTAARVFLRRLLELDSWTVTEAEDGLDGLERLRHLQPDVILLDLNMPRLDGFGFLENVRKNETWRRIPVVIISAREISGPDCERLNGGVEDLLRDGPYGARQIKEFLCEVLLGENASDPAEP